MRRGGRSNRRPSTRQIIRGIGLMLLCASLLQAAHAADLLEVYQLAQAHDATFEAARHEWEAAQEKYPQARAGYLPTVSLNAAANTTQAQSSFNGAPAIDRSVSTWNWTLQLTQPLVRAQNLMAIYESESQVAAAQAQFEQAQQDLILRVAQAYFDVLVAQEALVSADAQLNAFAEQGEAAKRGYELGTMSITDSHEARSKTELARFQSLSAMNDLDAKRTELERLTDQPLEQLAGLKTEAVAPKPEPADPQAWVTQAKDNNPAVRAQVAALRAAGFTVNKARAEHTWTLDFVASYGSNYASGSTSMPVDYETRITPAVAGVQFSMPLFAGGASSSHVREAMANKDKLAAQLDDSRRKAGAEAKQAYAGVVNGLAQTDALLAALEAGESSIKGNQAGYRLGIRINSDVLNAQQQFYASKRDLVKARYDTLIQGLKLKAAAGVLTEKDVEAINGMLAH